MSGPFESVRWNACVHRLDLDLYSHPEEFGGNGVRNHVKGATPGPRKETSAGQGLINISVVTETGESWEGRCAGVSRSAK